MGVCGKWDFTWVVDGAEKEREEETYSLTVLG